MTADSTQRTADPRSGPVELLPDYDAAGRPLSTIFDSRRWRRWAGEILALPIWLQALLVYLVSRIISVGIFAAVVRTQEPSPWTTGLETSLNDFLNFWDAAWYQRIADEGYPESLPIGESGDVVTNQWAFYPLHPSIVSDLALITGLDYQIISPILSTIFAGGAAVVILVLFRRHTTPGRALFGLAVLFVFPPAAIFSTGYAESLSLLLLALSLLLVVERRYLLAVPVVFLMDLSRPIGVAFSFFMLIHLIDRFRRRKVIPYPAGEAVRSWTLGVLSCVAALVHPIHAWIRTGSMTAYTDTEAAWHSGVSTYVVQWFDRAQSLVGPFGPPLLFATIALMLVLIYSPAGRQMGRTLQHFCLAYGIYILIFFTPQTSTLRMLLPMFPIALTMAYSRSWAYRIVLLVSLLMFQVIWVGYLWHFTPPADLPP